MKVLSPITMVVLAYSPSQFILLLLCFILPAFAILIYIKKQSRNSNENPPSPPTLPIIGHLHLLRSTPLHISFQSLATRYGPFMFIRAGGSTSYVVSNGTIAKEVFKTHDINFAARPEFGSSDHQIYKDTLFSTLDYGKYWIYLKKICVTELLSTKQIDKFSDLRKEEMMKLLDGLVKNSKTGEGCDLGIMLMAMTNNMICRMTMSTRCSGNSNESHEIRDVAKGITLLSGLLSLGEAFGPLKKYDLFGAGKKVKALLLRYDKLIDGVMMVHDQDIKGGKRGRKDMIDILLDISDDKSAEVDLSRNGIKALFLDLFLGGTDTTSVALQWAMAEVLNHPNALKKLQEEIDSVVGSNRLVQDSDIPNLPYLHAVVKETLRLHPSLPLVFRKCREDCKINGYQIKKNSRMVVNLYAINRDPNVWENAAEFKPERFLTSPSFNKCEIQNDDQGNTIVQDYNYVPFGGGRRGCPGAALAAAVLHRTLSTMIQCFDWKIEGDDKVNMEEGAGFSAAMTHPLICYPILRVDPFVIETFSN